MDVMNGPRRLPIGWPTCSSRGWSLRELHGRRSASARASRSPSASRAPKRRQKAASSPGGLRTKRAFPIGAEPATIKLVGPPADAIAIHNLDLEASDGAGRLLSRNSLEFCVVPRLKGPAPSLYAMDAAGA